MRTQDQSSFTQRVKDPTELWYRSQTQLRSHTAVAEVQTDGYSSDSTPRAWELPYASGAALKKKKKKTADKWTHTVQTPVAQEINCTFKKNATSESSTDLGHSLSTTAISRSTSLYTHADQWIRNTLTGENERRAKPQSKGLKTYLL